MRIGPSKAQDASSGGIAWIFLPLDTRQEIGGLKAGGAAAQAQGQESCLQPHLATEGRRGAGLFFRGKKNWFCKSQQLKKYSWRTRTYGMLITHNGQNWGAQDPKT